MMVNKRILLRFLVLLLCSTSPFLLSARTWMARTSNQSEKLTTEGTDFWVTWMTQNDEREEGEPEPECKLIISSRTSSSVVATNIKSGWSATIMVLPNTIAEIVVPLEECILTKSEVSETKVIHIESTSPISLYATNYQPHSFDATLVLPNSVLASDYVISNYEGVNVMIDDTSGIIIPSLFAIVATEDGTTIDITPSVDTYMEHSAGVPFSIVLNRGDAYQVASKGSSALSGTIVVARDNKKIAVFNGCLCAFVPNNKWACDHLVEQSMPTFTWGKHFGLTSSYGRNLDLFRVTALTDNTEIKINGVTKSIISARQTYEFQLTKDEQSAYLESSNPICCYLYLTGGELDIDSVGDPSMIMISPLEQQIDTITFATFQTSVIANHYVNIIIPTKAKSRISLDGTSISSKFKILSGNAAYSYAQIDVSNASHTLTTDSCGFVAHCYGLGVWESYGYNVGACVNTINNIDAYGELTEINIYDTICAGSAYSWNGSIYTSTGDYSYTTTSLITGADSTTILHLMQVEPSDSITTTTICEGQTFKWNSHYYTKAIDTTEILVNSVGCDSVCTLKLNMTPHTSSVQQAELCASDNFYYAGNHIIQSGWYVDSIYNTDGCLHIDSLYAKVWEETKISVDNAVACADSKYVEISYSYIGTVPEKISVYFGEAAKNEGFVDVDGDVIENMGKLTLPIRQSTHITDYPRPDYYTADLLFYNGVCEKPVEIKDYQFLLQYPSWLADQHWDNVIAVFNERYNGGYNFTHFQWYHNDSILVGETKPYIYVPQWLVMGDEYHVALTREDDGKTFCTCPMRPELVYDTIVPLLSYISVSPTKVVKENPVVSILCNIAGDYQIYNPTGTLIREGRFTPGAHMAYEVHLPSDAGCYIFRLLSEDNEQRSIKVMVY